MSSGQKAWAKEIEAQVFNEHKIRLKALGYGAIVETVNEISHLLQALEKDMVALPRSGWARIDKLKELIKWLG